MASVVKITDFGLVNGTTRTAYVTWTCSLSNIDHFESLWVYYVGGIDPGFRGADNEIAAEPWPSGTFTDQYTAPDNAYGVRVWVKPVSKTHKVNGNDTYYWTGEWTLASDWGYRFEENNPPVKPDTPIVSLDTTQDGNGKYKLNLSTGYIDDNNTEYMQFNILVNGGVVDTVYAIKWGFYCTAYVYLSPGRTYRAICRGINSLTQTGTAAVTIPIINGNSDSATLYSPVYGQWSEYSSDIIPPPDKPTNLACSAYDETSVKLTWKKATGASGYEIAYSKQKEYLEDSSNSVSTQTVDGDTDSAYVTGLDSGEEWFFKIRATNSSGSSSYSDIVSTIIGTTPEAPTTWSSTTVATIGDVVNLYWVHNCEDNSKESAAEIKLTLSNTYYEIIDITDEENGDDETTHSYSLETDDYSDGTEIKWQVRTAGILGEFGEWSTTRTIKIYAPASLSIEMPDTLTSFPFTIITEALPESQKAISYSISVYATDYYEITGVNGETEYVSAGDEIYSKVYNMNSKVTPQVIFTLSVGDLTLKNSMTYKVVITAAMNSGVSVDASGEFTVNFDSTLYQPDASIGFNNSNYTAYIAPYCEEIVDWDESQSPDTATRELVSGITMSVYRREYNGKLTFLGGGIENTGAATITDPHPSLDYARYRVVVQDDKTGQITYEDIPGLPVLIPYIVIQWDDKWYDFDYRGPEEIIENPTWSGSMVVIKGNIDISESNDSDSSLIEYTGRESPVAYYGTQIGEGGTWNFDVEKSDKNTIYQLRRLSRYMGNVYVREPSGIGYWARITVSMNTNHCAMVVPVTLNVTKVEGGV